MSIVNAQGCRIYPLPKARPATNKYSPADQIRNRRWLHVQRQFHFSNRELARFLSRRPRTVDEGLLWATVEEQDQQDRAALGYESAPVDGSAEGLTEDDIADLRARFLVDTPEGDDPDVRDFFARISLPQLTRAEQADNRRRRRAGVA